MSNSPHVSLLQLATGATSPAITIGDDNFAAAGSLFEPFSVGELPIAPKLITRGQTVYGIEPRKVRAVAGYAVTGAMVTAGRARWSLEWKILTRAERDSLVSFFANLVLASVNSGGLRGFDLEPDGPGTGAIAARPLGAFGSNIVARGNGAELFKADAMEAEELIG